MKYIMEEKQQDKSKSPKTSQKAKQEKDDGDHPTSAFSPVRPYTHSVTNNKDTTSRDNKTLVTESDISNIPSNTSTSVRMISEEHIVLENSTTRDKPVEEHIPAWVSRHTHHIMAECPVSF